MAKTVRTLHSARRPSAKTVNTPAKRRKLSKRLEQVARAIKDSDEFVRHITGLRDRYRREQALGDRSTQAAVRQATRTLHKHASALAHWLERATANSTTEYQSLDQLDDSSLRPMSPQVLDWLTRASTAAAASSTALGNRRRNGADNTALLVAAEGLRAIFEHHKLKLSTSGKKGQPAQSVLLLCAVAHEAGNGDLRPEMAKTALRPRRQVPPTPPG